MVSPFPHSTTPSTTPSLSQSGSQSLANDALQCQEAPFVEQHFPRQMSWYAPEGPQGTTEAISRWIRENPWPALGLAAASGILLALVTIPSANRTPAASTTRTVCRSCGCDD